jgi:hypothetical protein
MQRLKHVAAGLAVVLLLSTGVSFATDINEVAALLVYPVVVGLSGTDNVETFMTFTNAGPVATAVHVSFINGDALDTEYCYECDFTIPMTANDTETLILTNNVTGGISIESEDGTVSFSCDQPYGFVIVALEDGLGSTIAENYLLGEEVIVNYTQGMAYSLPAVPFQGIANDGDREYEFNGTEYKFMPRIVAADFIAPDVPAVGLITAELALFTLDFERQHPPATDCSVEGYDAAEWPFSDSVLFGCWTLTSLYSISTEFAYPNLGQFPGDKHTHGYLTLDCEVNPEDGPEVDGGVHGAIIQHAYVGATIRRNDPTAPSLSGSAAWANLLYQSTTNSDAVTLDLETAGGIIP